MPPLIVGLGSPHGDDQAGWCVIRTLHDLGVSAIDAKFAQSPADLCETGHVRRDLIVCDAVVDGRPVGSIGAWNWPAQRLPAQRGGSHDLSLDEALSLAVQVQAAPPQIVVWMISSRDFHPLSPPSQDVRAGAERLARQLYQRWYDA